MKPFAKWLVWLSSAGTALTGAVYWWMDSMLSPMDEWAVINHPFQPAVLKAHILVAPVLVFAIGLIAADHVWKQYRSPAPRARRSGLASMWVIVPMVLTGYLIQAVTHAGWLAAIAWTHIGTGALYAVALVGHQVAVHRSRVAAATRLRERVTADGPVRTTVGRADLVA